MTMVVTMLDLWSHCQGEYEMSIDGDGTTTARTIKASEFKARCLQLMDEVAESGEEIIITKHGRPVSKLAPYREKPKTYFGVDKGRYPFLQEVIDTLDRGEGADVVWEAEQGLIDGKPC